jgi:hypothetical protein
VSYTDLISPVTPGGSITSARLASSKDGVKTPTWNLPIDCNRWAYLPADWSGLEDLERPAPAGIDVHLAVRSGRMVMRPTRLLEVTTAGALSSRRRSDDAGFRSRRAWRGARLAAATVVAMGAATLVSVSPASAVTPPVIPVPPPWEMALQINVGTSSTTSVGGPEARTTSALWTTGRLGSRRSTSGFHHPGRPPVTFGEPPESAT